MSQSHVGEVDNGQLYTFYSSKVDYYNTSVWGDSLCTLLLKMPGVKENMIQSPYKVEYIAEEDTFWKVTFNPKPVPGIAFEVHYFHIKDSKYGWQIVKQSSLAFDAFLKRRNEIANTIVHDENGKRYYVLQTFRPRLADPAVYYLTDTLLFDEPKDTVYCNELHDAVYSLAGPLYVAISDAHDRTKLIAVKNLTGILQDSSFRNLQLVNARFAVITPYYDLSDSLNTTWRPAPDDQWQGDADYGQGNLFSIYTTGKECREVVVQVKVWPRKGKIRVKRKVCG